jgi:hypothetical protein
MDILLEISFLQIGDIISRFEKKGFYLKGKGCSQFLPQFDGSTFFFNIVYVP